MGDINTKQEFIDIWDSMLPAGILEHATTPLPTAPTVGTPDNVDAAIIAQGVLAKYLLDVFAAYDGFTFVDLVLHIGQRNAVNKAMMVTGVQAAGDKGGKHEISIHQPQHPDFLLSEELLFCDIEIFGDLTGLTDVSITLKKPDGSSIQSAMVPSDESGHFYTEIGLYDVGEHTLEFSATVDGYTFSDGPITITAFEEVV